MPDEPDASGAAPPEDADPVPRALSYAGSVVDKAIEYLVGRDIDELSIASALLGGAIGLLARSLDDAAIVAILNNAIAGVQAGEIERLDQPPATADEP